MFSVVLTLWFLLRIIRRFRHFAPKVTIEILHRDGQRCVKLLALISTPSIFEPKVIPQRPFGQSGQTLMACTVVEALQKIVEFSLVVLHKEHL